MPLRVWNTWFCLGQPKAGVDVVSDFDAFSLTSKAVSSGGRVFSSDSDLVLGTKTVSFQLVKMLIFRFNL